MSSFIERQKSLFNQLKDAEEQCSFAKTNKTTTVPDYSVVDRRTYKKLKHEMKQFRGRESIFKKEPANIQQCLRAKTIPDYIRNPQNWAYYTLSDVTPDQMSDATNMATALASIQEMESRNANNISMETDTDETGAVFKRPSFHLSKTVKKEEEQAEKAVFKSNKVIMPEYVVGVTKKKEKTGKKQMQQHPDATKKADLKLNHLYDDENEED